MFWKSSNISASLTRSLLSHQIAQWGSEEPPNRPSLLSAPFPPHTVAQPSLHSLLAIKATGQPFQVFYTGLFPYSSKLKVTLIRSS